MSGGEGVSPHTKHLASYGLGKTSEQSSSSAVTHTASTGNTIRQIETGSMGRTRDQPQSLHIVHTLTIMGGNAFTVGRQSTASPVNSQHQSVQRQCTLLDTTMTSWCRITVAIYQWSMLVNLGKTYDK